MRHSLGRHAISGLCIAVSLLFYPAIPAQAEVSFSVGLHLGIQVPVFPRLALIPGYPVYYAPRLDLNYFFYDGLYWVFQDDEWYSSGWYNGPWHRVSPFYVPTFILRIPVFYYRRPPVYFRNWRTDTPPHWNERWGRDWEARRSNWDRWDRRTTPRPAPLPIYQRQYSGPRYPGATEQQHRIRSDNYRYQPREDATRQEWRPQERPDNWRSEPPPRVTPPNQQWRPQPTPPGARSPAPSSQQQERARDRITPPTDGRDMPRARPIPPQQTMPSPRMDRQERTQESRGRPQQESGDATPQKRRKLPSAEGKERQQAREPFRSQ